MSSFTKPCNVLSMFLNFEPWKPYVLISFVLIKKKKNVSQKIKKQVEQNQTKAWN